MPFVGSLEGALGYGRGPNAADNIMNVQWSTYLPAMVSGANPVSSYGITDSLGNTYLTGTYTSGGTAQVNIRNASGISQIESSYNLPGNSNNENVYLIKFNSSGQVLWATYFQTNRANTEARKLVVDSNNNVYMTGIYQQATTAIQLRDVNGTSTIVSNVTLPALNAPSGYLIKYDTNGVVQWATYIGIVNQVHRLVDLYIFSNFLYVVGTKNSSSVAGITNLYSANGNTNAPFQNITSISLPNTGNQGFGLVLQYNLNGIAQWATVIPSSSIFGVSCNRFGHINVVGTYSSTTSINLKAVDGNSQIDSGWTLQSTGASGTSGCFIIKYSDGGAIYWATILKTNTTSGTTNINYSVDTDTQGHIYITGTYAQNTDPINLFKADFSTNGQTSSTITLSNTSTSGNMFLIKYDTFDGFPIWALNLGTSSTTAVGYGLVINKITNFIYIVGTYSTTAAITLNNASGNSQISSTVGLPASTGRGFVMKYTLDGKVKCATYISNQSVTPYYISLFGNSLYISIDCGTFPSANKQLYNASANGQTLTSYVLLQISPTTTTCNGIVKYTG